MVFKNSLGKMNITHIVYLSIHKIHEESYWGLNNHVRMNEYISIFSDG